jgi:hypothetical protein
MKNLQKCGSWMRGLAAGLAVLSCVGVAKATPFASCVTNNAGTISFYLNEGGGNVTVTYDDGSTNANFNGVTTGTNLAAGIQSFVLTGHNSYSISVFKIGSGTPGVISSRGIGTTRGVDANKIPTSPYFGHVYDVQGGSGVWLMNSDLSLVAATAQSAGVTWNNTGTGTGQTPDWVSVAPDSSVLVAGSSTGGTCVYQMTPDFSTNQLFLGPVGTTAGLAAGSHGTLESRPLLSGSIAQGNAVLYVVDGDLNPLDSMQVWNIGAGPLPWTNPPSYAGAGIAVSGVTAETVGGNEFAGLTQGPNGYIYGSTYRSTNSWPYVTITDSTGSNVLWTSQMGNPPAGDWFIQQRPDGGAYNSGIAGTSAVSEDGNYFVAASIQNYFIIAPLTNGIPDTSKIFTVAPTGYGANGRGVCWDAADNIILSSSGLGLVQEWTLGGTGTAVTSGNGSGTTNFQLISVATTASVVATTPQASQGGVNGTPGTPVPGVFNITRFSTNGYSSPLAVNFTLSGTATNGVYTTSPSVGINVDGTGVITIPAGATNVTLTINPTTNNVPRLTNTVILTLVGAGSYSTAVPFSDTVYIQNTSSQQMNAIATGAASMYKAFSNDYAYVNVQRLGDVTVPAYTLSPPATSGTAVAGTDYTTPTTPTFNPGDVTQPVVIQPLAGGLPPVDTNNPVFTGNKVATITLTAGTGYTIAPGSAAVNLTIIDNAEPTAALLYSNPLTDPNDAANWNVTYGANDMVNVATDDFEADFGYDITSNVLNTGAIGPAPNGATNVLRVTVNKKYNPGVASGVNAYPTNISFSGNFAMRFNMCLVQGSALSSATEGALVGINHNGHETNWWIGSGSIATNNPYPYWASDGYWFWICSDAGGAANGDYIGFTGNGNAATNHGFAAGIVSTTHVPFVNNFKNSNSANPAPLNIAGLGPFTSQSAAGVPADASGNTTGNSANTWADVEIKQINNVVTLSIDKVPILVQTNATPFNTSGTLMLGYNDPFPSVGNPDGAVYYSNVRVVQLGLPVITSITSSGTNIVINFITTDGDDSISSFNLLSGTNVVGSSTIHVDTVVAGAVFTQLGTGAFQVTTPKPASAATYYRIKHN